MANRKIAGINKEKGAQRDKDPLTWQVYALLPVSWPLWDTGTLEERTAFQVIVFFGDSS